jgi:hypothetical protein
MKTVLKIFVIFILLFTNSYAQLTHTFTQTAHINERNYGGVFGVGPDGVVFVTSPDSLHAYYYNGFSFINTANIDIPDVNDIQVGNEGIIFLSAGDSGLWAYSYNGSSFTKTTHVVEDSGRANSIAISPDGTIFLANDLDGLRAYTYDRGSFTNTAHVDDDGGVPKSGWLGAFGVAVGSDGTIFLGTGWDGLWAYSYDGSSFANIANCGYDTVDPAGFSSCGFVREIFDVLDDYIFVEQGNIAGMYFSVFKYQDFTFTIGDSSIDYNSRFSSFDLAIGTEGIIFVIINNQLAAYTYDGSSFTNTALIETTGGKIAVGLDGTVFVASEDSGLFAYKYDLAAAIANESTQIPLKFALSQNYPNPFNPSTNIEFDLPQVSNVRIEVYNTTGQQIHTLLNTKMSAGSHKVEFNAQNLSSGVYFYKINAGEFQDVKKMILLR